MGETKRSVGGKVSVPRAFTRFCPDVQEGEADGSAEGFSHPGPRGDLGAPTQRSLGTAGDTLWILTEDPRSLLR